MEESATVQQHILQTTLDGVKSELGDDLCVICLDHVSEKARAYPCKHDSFDFLCLISWLQEKSTCPLCKATVKSVQYDLDSPQGAKTFTPTVAPPKANSTSHRSPARPALLPRRERHARTRLPTESPSEDDTLSRRRSVYRNKLMSKHVGTNRISQYKDFTPLTLSRNEALISRARKWIRRELQVFSFLGPDASGTSNNNNPSSAPGADHQRRRSSNAEFLLEYIVAVIKTIDLKGSGGQAVELLQEFLGRENAAIFVHELEAWLRSPYERLEDWDRHVQYDERSGNNSGGGSKDLATSAGFSQSRRPSSSPPRRVNARGWDSWRPPRHRNSRTDAPVVTFGSHAHRRQGREAG
ncbi:MAG: hypothetical protein Q9160_004569 [Pyrenula sp. 1 TL-2023]